MPTQCPELPTWQAPSHGLTPSHGLPTTVHLTQNPDNTIPNVTLMLKNDCCSPIGPGDTWLRLVQGLVPGVRLQSTPHISFHPISTPIPPLCHQRYAPPGQHATGWLAVYDMLQHYRCWPHHFAAPIQAHTHTTGTHAAWQACNKPSKDSGTDGKRRWHCKVKHVERCTGAAPAAVQPV
jgi:hypothetical protein